MGVGLPLFVKGHELRCGPQGAGDPQMVEGGLEMWDMVFLGASPLLCQTKVLYSASLSQDLRSCGSFVKFQTKECCTEGKVQGKHKDWT